MEKKFWKKNCDEKIGKKNVGKKKFGKKIWRKNCEKSFEKKILTKKISEK